MKKGEGGQKVTVGMRKDDWEKLNFRGEICRILELGVERRIEVCKQSLQN